MTSWLHAAPAVFLAVALLGLPGLVVAVSLRFRRWDALGLAAPLSLGVLGLATVASEHLGPQWGLPLIAATAVVVALVGGVAAHLLRSNPDSVGRAVDGVWSRRENALALAATAGAAVVGAAAMAHGIGNAHALNQTIEAATHVNVIATMAHEHSASPGVLAGLINPSGNGGYAPSLFAAVASLLVTYAHVSPIVAANVMAVAITLAWPFTVAMVVRRLVRPTVFGYIAAMIGAVTVGLFPVAFVVSGTTWPSALSVLALGPGWILALRLLGVERTLGSGLPRVASGLALALVGVGIGYAQPSTVFGLCYFIALAVVWLGWRRLVPAGASQRVRQRRGLAVLAGVVLVTAALVWLSQRVSEISAAHDFYQPRSGTWAQALGQVAFLGSQHTAGNAAFAVLLLVGIYGAFCSTRGRYLVASFALLGLLYVGSASTQSSFSMWWSGYWYNDPQRIVGMLPVVALPLVAVGADSLRSWWTRGVEAQIAASRTGWPSKRINANVVGVAVAIIGLYLLQPGLGTAKLTVALQANTLNATAPLVTVDQEAMFGRLGAKLEPGLTIAGDPYAGEIYAGALSGHSVVFSTFYAPVDPTLALVAARFRDYRSDPAVCAAVTKLRIGVVVTGTHVGGEPVAVRNLYAGFENLDGVEGLTPIDSGGGATAFRVGPCTR